jgi:DNA-binding FadR family transcriptional regulator
MKNISTNPQRLSIFMQYLSTLSESNGAKIPSLIELSQILGVSVASLREQMEVARIMGLIEVKPRTGIQKVPYSFSKSVLINLTYALINDPSSFDAYSDLRKHIESAYWKEAVSLLSTEDVDGLFTIINVAFNKLHAKPPQIPHEEHKRFHLSMYKKLNNIFVTGILEAYWQAYEDVGLDVYTDLQYLEQVWLYHQKTVESIAKGELDSGYKSFAEHMEMISKRSTKPRISRFE